MCSLGVLKVLSDFLVFVKQPAVHMWGDSRGSLPRGGSVAVAVDDSDR